MQASLQGWPTLLPLPIFNGGAQGCMCCPWSLPCGSTTGLRTRPSPRSPGLPAVTAQNVGRLEDQWIEITPRGCSYRHLPPRGVRVLLYFPTECAGPKCGKFIFGEWINRPMLLGFNPDTAAYSPPSHWMLVAQPTFRR